MKGVIFTKIQLSAIMGYCGITDPSKTPIVVHIWGLQGGGQLQSQYFEWDGSTGRQKSKQVEIVSIYLLKPTMKDSIGVKPNHAQPVPTFEFTGKGISIWACCFQTSSDIKNINKYDEAVWAIHDNRSLVEALKISKLKPQQPSKTIFTFF